MSFNPSWKPAIIGSHPSGDPALRNPTTGTADCCACAASYTEAHLATDNELLRNILLAVMSSLAKVEAQKIGERTRAGMARAKAQGKHIGRPALDPALRRKIAKHMAAGLSAYAVAKQLGIDPHTAAKYAPFGDGGVSTA